MKIKEFNPESFAAALAAGGDLLADFYAPWCSPCRNMARELEKFAEQYPDVVIGKVNIDNGENGELAATFGVSAIPSLFFFRDGKLILHLSGFVNSRVLAEKLGFS